MAATGSVEAQDNDVDEERLDFVWTNDETAFGVRYLDVKIVEGRGPPDRRVYTQSPEFWRLREEIFGPDAKFILRVVSAQDGRRAYELRVAGANYGRLRGRSIRFRFVQAAVPTEGGRTNRRFLLTATTTVWSSESGATIVNPFTLVSSVPSGHPAEAVLLRDFIKCDGPTLQRRNIPVRRVSNTLRLMLNGLVAHSGSGAANVTVSLDARGRWSVASETAVLSACGGRVALTTLTVYWPIIVATKTTCDDSPPDGRVEREAPLFARAELATPNRVALRFGGAGGPALTAESAAKAKLVVRMDRISPEALTLRAEAALWSDAWQIAVDGGGASGSVGTMPTVFGTVLERVDAPVAADDTDYARRKGTVSFQGGYREPEKKAGKPDGGGGKEIAIATPLGPIIARSLREMDKAAEDKAREGFPRRSGWPVSALFAWDLGGIAQATRESPRTEYIECSVAMKEAGIRLPGADYSRLNFDDTELKIFYTREPLKTPPLDSYIDLAPRPGAERARLDLARARLRASQSHHLLALTFRFSDFGLSFRDGGGAELMRYTSVCDLTTRPAAGDALEPHDTRPIIVVEFPPQHLFEETRFVPTLPPMPDVRLDAILVIDRRSGEMTTAQKLSGARQFFEAEDSHFKIDGDNRVQVTDVLARLPSQAARKTFRKSLSDTKSGLDPCPAPSPGQAANARVCPPAGSTEFKAFRDRIKPLLARLPGLPQDQTDYIGPFALDVDAMRVARDQQRQIHDETIEGFLDEIFKTVLKYRMDLETRFAETAPVEQFTDTLEKALALEIALQKSIPAYQQFRTFYRDQLVLSGLLPEEAKVNPPASSTAAGEVEFFSSVIGRRTPFPGAPDIATLTTRFETIKTLYRAELFGDRALLDGPSRGRLARPSRLAFRVKCRDGLEAARQSYPALDVSENDVALLPRPELPFELDALLNFKDFELSVVRRAQVVYDPGKLGQISSRKPRVPDTTTDAMLRHLDFAAGSDVVVRQRLADVAASLDPPGALETAIVLPARLTLSPHQNAIVLTPHPVDEGIFDDVIEPGAACAPRTGPRAAHTARLWAASFVTGESGSGLDPGVRVVHSPDLRPSALLGRFAESALTTGSGTLDSSTPPGGLMAPWFLQRIDSENAGMTQEQAAAIVGVDKPESLCADGGSSRGSLHPMIARLCNLFRLRKRNEKALRFRAPMDARDRHELVILSSAWGLPVVGRRDAQGMLTKDASQSEFSESFNVIDIAAGSAVYEPRPLKVSELALTAIGGTLRHDTGFQPPAGAHFWRDKVPVFDALSIERWQQWTNLGRDIFAEIVYKGFLFPLGIRASLIKVTERIFHIDAKTGAITAPLRQRMFIRIANPEKDFPALKQPFAGRWFPCDALKMLTTKTPDIVDPYSSDVVNEREPSASGRVKLPGTIGLVFWPRVAKLAQANVRFDFLLDDCMGNLPLLFVDNTAANDPRTVSAVVEYYNGLPSPECDGTQSGAGECRKTLDPLLHLRTLGLQGIKRRYAAETESGSATLATRHWTLRATGLLRGLPSDKDHPGLVVVPDTSDYTFDPQLQGADQPPFYPAVETALVELTQTERLIGRPIVPVTAKFDLRYLVHGFELSDASKTPDKPAYVSTAALAADIKPDNTSEIFLAVHEERSLDMGAKGDQSGGVFRPSGAVVAVSRKKGAMTQSVFPQLLKDHATDAALVAVSDRFTLAATSDRAAPDVGPSSAAPGAENDRARQGDANGKNAIEELRKIYKEFFDPKAKILGIVPMRDLIELIIGLSSPDQGLPKLTETLEFSAASVAGEATGVDDVLAIIRKDVIEPLAGAVRMIRDEWDEIEAAVVAAQDKANLPTQPITIAEVFPALDRSLTELSEALDRAAGQTDTILFGIELGICYSAGRRFLDAVKRTAANPGAQISAAISERFSAALSVFQGLFKQGQLATLLKATLGDGLTDITATLSGAIKRLYDTPLPDTSRLLLAMPTVPLSENEAANCLKMVLPSSDDVVSVLSAFAQFIVSNGVETLRTPDDVDRVVREFLDAKKERLTFMPRSYDPDAIVAKLEAMLADVRSTWASALGIKEADVERAFDDLIERLREIEPGVVRQNAKNRLEFVEDTVADKIRNRYIIGVVVGLAGCDYDKLPRFGFGLVRFLQSMTVAGSAERILPDLTGMLAPLAAFARAIGALAKALTATVPPDLTGVLAALRAIMDAIDISFPPVTAAAFCTTFAPVWAVAKVGLDCAETLATPLSLCDVAAAPRCPLADADLGAFKADVPKLCDAVGRIAFAANAMKTKVTDLGTPLDEAIKRLDELKDPNDPRFGDAAQRLTTIRGAIDEVSGHFKAIDMAARQFYCTIEEDAAALQAVADALKGLAALNVCAGNPTVDQSVVDALKTLANLPRDVDRMVALRRRVLDDGHALLRAILVTLRDFDTDRAKLAIPIVVGLQPLFTKLELWGSGSTGSDYEPPDWLTDSDAVAAMKDVVAAAEGTADDIAALLKSVASVVCNLVDQAASLTDTLERAGATLEVLLAKPADTPGLAELTEVVRRHVRIDAITATVAEVRTKIVTLKTVADKLCVNGSPRPDIANLANFGNGLTIDTVLRGIAPVDDVGLPFVAARLARSLRAVVETVDELRSLTDETLHTAILKLLEPLANKLLAASQDSVSLCSVYDNLRDRRDELYGTLVKSVLGDVVAKRLLVPPDAARPDVKGYTRGTVLTEKNDQLAGDAAWLEFLTEEAKNNRAGTLSDPAKFAFLAEFLREWGAGEPTPVLILLKLEQLVDQILSGDFFRALDFKHMREAVEGYLLSLLPAKARLGYDFNIKLGKEVAAATAGIFSPGPDTSLSIDMEILVNLTPGAGEAVTFRSVGTIGPFDIKLIGDLFDALTLKFASARFEARSGEKQRFDIAYKDYLIGKELDFLQQLQSFLTPKDGSGAFVRFEPSMPGVDAGYRLQLGDFSVGNLAFSNVGLETGAILPFTDNDAVFRASLSSRASPFTLTYAPYGGSGFFSILANPKGIVGFEALFEFGGSAVFAYGPLNGKGRLMSGVYIRQLKLGNQRVSELSMTFYAGGSASIWVFNFAASLSVNLGMVNGNMTGEATFSFSFSMGIADFNYSVSVKKDEKKGFNGQSSSALQSNVRYARLGEDRDGRSEDPGVGKIRSNVVCQSERWNIFKTYYEDLSVPKDYF